jgi:hypothetical protein
MAKQRMGMPRAVATGRSSGGFTGRSKYAYGIGRGTAITGRGSGGAGGSGESR